MKKVIKLTVFFLILMAAAFLEANPGPGTKSKTDLKDVVARLRLYEGFRGESNPSSKVISSYYLKQLPGEEVFSDMDAPKEQDTLKRVFNLADLKLMTQATMRLRKAQNKTPFQVIVLNGRKLLVQLSGIPGQENRFRVEVLEEGPTPRPLLETRLILPEEKSTVLGFEDSGAHIYFLSFHRLRDEPPPPPPPLPAGKPEKPLPDPINMKRSRVIHKVEPKYPEVALKAEVEGSVVVVVNIDESGNVVEAKVINGHPLLRQAALTAIKQWRYEPYSEAGKTIPIQSTVVMRFNLDKRKETEPIAISAVEQPKLIKKVEPVYPPEALKAEIQGKVVLEAVTDLEGNVKEVNVIDGIPRLDRAAVAALKQWKYEPYTVNGVKKPVKFTVIVRFNLKKKEKGKTGAKEPVVLSVQQRPKLVKKVSPQYPEEALKAGTQGKVVIEAVTDHQGRVVDAKVIDGHPMLNTAALKAIKQWQYEPYIIDGVKKAVKFTVILKFNLKEKPKQPQDKK